MQLFETIRAVFRKLRIRTLMCVIFEHEFVVWVRSGSTSPRHPHLGTWARCERCGLERDWLFEGLRDDDAVRDEVHGTMRSLREVIAVARGAIHAADPSPAIAAALPVETASRPRSLRRRNAGARSSVRGAVGPRDHADSERNSPLDD